MITGSDETPTQVVGGIDTIRHDIRTTHEEADLILIQQCYKMMKVENYKSVRIISDDADVFVLACYHFPEDDAHVQNVYMEPTKKGRAVTNIGGTVQRHQEIIPFLPQADAVSGCDSAARYHGIGKATVVKVMQRKNFQGVRAFWKSR